MRALLGKFIDPVQNALFPQRSIHNNILLAHKVITKFNIMKRKRS